MLDASVIALSLVGRGELLIAEALIIGNLIDHPKADSGVREYRLFKIDQGGGGVRTRRSSIAQKDA